ncbi:MAG: selB [Gemmatimonadetes bacterium]|nr:selB [Gemmatimonadota bacterium]
MILGTAGHIDHGKTTLVRALTGVDTDRLPEEKRRGITIELGFAPLVLEGFGTVGVVDVPGHEAFVRTMVAGATGIDLALVVVAADEGVMPQTREHLAILELLGVRRGVVALTKVDLVDDEWLALVEEDVRAAIGRALPGAPIVATSSETGRGLPELRSALTELARATPSRTAADLFRMPIDRAFTIKGTGTVVTGTVWSGQLERDDTARVLPGDRTARVRGVQAHGSQVAAAGPGTRTAVALAGLDVADVARGSTIVTDRNWRATTMARADVTLVPDLDVAVRPRTWFRLHVGTAEVGARIVSRGGLAASDPVGVRLMLDAPVLLRAGDRFVLRTSAPLNTIGGGVVTDPYAPKRARPWPGGLSALERLDLLVEESGSHGVDAGTLPVRLGAPPAACEQLVADATDRFVVAAGRIVSRRVFTDLSRQLVELVRRYHAEHGLEPGIPTQLLRNGLHASPEVMDAVFQSSLGAGELVATGGVLSLPDWLPSLSAEEQRATQTIVSILASAQSEPPSVEELWATLGADPSPLLRYLDRNGKVVQVEQNRYYETSQLRLFLDRMRGALSGGVELGPSELRETLGLSRKFLIPLLEYCDRLGYTNRGAIGRVWRGP